MRPHILHTALQLAYATTLLSALASGQGLAFTGTAPSPANREGLATAALPAQAPNLPNMYVAPWAPELHLLADSSPLRRALVDLIPALHATAARSSAGARAPVAASQPSVLAPAPAPGVQTDAVADAVAALQAAGGPGSQALAAAPAPDLPRVAAPVNWLDGLSPLPAARAYASLSSTILCQRAALFQLVVSGRNLEPFDATRQLLLAKAVDDTTKFAPHSLDISSAQFLYNLTGPLQRGNITVAARDLDIDQALTGNTPILLKPSVYTYGGRLMGPAGAAYNSDPPAANLHDYMVSKTLGGLHRVAVNLTLAATPFNLQAITAALQGNATRALNSSAPSGGAALPIDTLFAYGGPVRVDPLAARGGLLQQLARPGMGVEDVTVLSMEWLPPPTYMQSSISWYDDYCFTSSAPASASISAPSYSSGSGSSGSAFGGISAPFVGIIALVIFLAARANRKSKAEEAGQGPGQGTGQQVVVRRMQQFSLARLASRQSVAAGVEGQRGVPAQAGAATAARPAAGVPPGMLPPPGGDLKRQFWV